MTLIHGVHYQHPVGTFNLAGVFKYRNLQDPLRASEVKMLNTGETKEKICTSRE
jgi:hypothetical protein